MTRQFHIATYIVIACCMLAVSDLSSTPLARPERIEIAGAFRHSASGMIFPATVGEFHRAEIVRYDQDGMDIGVGYNLGTPTMAIVATIYIYPAPPLTSIGSPQNVIDDARSNLCNREFQSRKKEIADFHRGAQPIEETTVARPDMGPWIPGKLARYEFDEPIREVVQPVHSDLYVFCYAGGKWSLEYRFTYPRRFDGTATIRAFMADLSWGPSLQ